MTEHQLQVSVREYLDLVLAPPAIWTSIDVLHPVSRELEKTLGEAEAVKLAWKPGLKVELGASDAATLLKLIDVLDEDDDVQTVWGNYEISDEVMEQLG